MAKQKNFMFAFQGKDIDFFFTIVRATSSLKEVGSVSSVMGTPENAMGSVFIFVSTLNIMDFE